MAELVSICIPLYNGEKYLRECLDSVLSQTHRELEIIISDDGSTDVSLAIVKEYMAKDSRIRLNQNKNNLGLVGNWNHCVELATGEWIKFLFQDDRMDPACVEKMLAAAKRQKAGFVVCKREFFMNKDISDELREQYKRAPLSIEALDLAKEEKFISAERISNAAAENISLNFIGEPPVTFFNKETVKSFGGYDDRLAQICDLEFCLRAGTVKGIAYVPYTLVWIRVHGDSTTSRNLQSKYYTMRHADPVILAHELLHSERYASFRKHLSAKNLLRLKKFLAVRSYEAYKADKVRFEAMTGSFPGLKGLVPPSLSTRLVYWLVKWRRKFRA